MVRVQEGDQEAYRTLLDDIAPSLLGFLRRRIHDPHELEDAYQETLVALHRARHTYDPRRPVEPWLFTIARNVVADHGRRARRRGREVVLDTANEPAADPERNMGLLFKQALGQLPRNQRDAFEMLKLEGLSVAEAAARAGTTNGALRVRAHRAYVFLRTLLRS